METISQIAEGLGLLVLCLFSFLIRMASYGFFSDSKRGGRFGSGFDAGRPSLSEELELEEAFQDRSFLVGKFKGKLRCFPMGKARRSKRDHFGNGGAFSQPVKVVFSVAIPSAQAFSFTLDLPGIPPGFESFSDQEFIDSFDWKMRSLELRDALQRTRSVQILRELFSLGPGRIHCAGNTFSISIKMMVASSGNLGYFETTSKKFFRAFAQVAQLNLIEWRSAENNYDWWIDNDITAV